MIWKEIFLIGLRIWIFKRIPLYCSCMWIEFCLALFFYPILLLCCILGVVPFNMWLISTWEEYKCCYKLRKCIKLQLFSLKITAWVKQMSFCAFAQLVTTFIFFSAWDKSCVKWNNSGKPTEKKRTFETSYILSDLWTKLIWKGVSIMSSQDCKSLQLSNNH